MEERIEFDMLAALGADAGSRAQRFSLYIPDKDRHGRETGTQRRWVLEALDLMTQLNGGATAEPAVEGVWQGPGGPAVWEHPVIVYSFIDPERFFAEFSRVREFLHRMGRETRQGEVVAEFEGELFRITRFDA
jgi:hypothetical protein